MQTDKVTLSEREQLATANGYYQTAMHELDHATGHPVRLDRDTLKNGLGKECLEAGRNVRAVMLQAVEAIRRFKLSPRIHHSQFHELSLDH